MKNMLINLSNHSWYEWSNDQKAAAAIYGTCIDIQFPTIPADEDESYVESLSDKYLSDILKAAVQNETVVHIMGEMTFVFSLVKKLQKAGIKCIASTTERITLKITADTYERKFAFSRFREYSSL